MIALYRLVLFDVGNLLVVDSKDISEYVSESIRSIYGRIVKVDLSKYDGQSSQDIAEDLLRKDKMPEEEIRLKLKRYTEDLFYTYYNVAGHDRLALTGGARELLAQLWKDDIGIGIATGEVERIARFRIEKAGILGFFKTGAYGNDGKGPDDIIKIAVDRARSELKVDGSGIVLVAGAPHMIRAAKSAGIAAIGVAGAGHSEEELTSAGADLVVKSLKERSEILSFLTSSLV